MSSVAEKWVFSRCVPVYRYMILAASMNRDALNDLEDSVSRLRQGDLGALNEVMTRYQYAYPGKDPIELIFFRVRHFTGEPRNLIFHDLRWHPRFLLAELDFIEGDREFIHGIYTSAYGNHD